MVRTAMNIFAGEGVARSLYYHRTGEVLDRSALHRLKTIQEDSTLERGSAAETLLDDLRYTLHNFYRLIPLYTLALPRVTGFVIHFWFIPKIRSMCRLHRCVQCHKRINTISKFTAESRQS